MELIPITGPGEDVRALQVIEPKEETIIIVLLREHNI